MMNKNLDNWFRRFDCFSRGCFWIIMFFVIVDAAEGFRLSFKIISIFACLFAASTAITNFINIYKHWNRDF